jgi:hypothetical protein
MNNMIYRLSRGLILIVLVVFLSGCCFIDYTDEVRELGDRYRDKIIAFYEQHQRYPTSDEIEKLRSDLGCILKSSLYGTYKCGSTEYKITGGYNYAPDQEVRFGITRSSTLCQYEFHLAKDGTFTISQTQCLELPCIEWGR